MRMTVVSNNKETIKNLKKSYMSHYIEFPHILSLFTYDASIALDEGTMTNMYSDIEACDICLLDVDDANTDVFFNAVYASINCKGFIVPCGGYGSSIRNLLKLRFIRMKDIVSVNPNYDIQKNFEYMKKMIDSIEEQGKTISTGKLKDFRNYLNICDYVKRGDKQSMDELLKLILSAYGNPYESSEKIC